jgi:hypothetical protein
MRALSQQHDALYEQLMAISHQACNMDAYELAYHTLYAAMCRAEQLDNVPLLEEVLQEADLQHQQVDSIHPEHRFSSVSAAQWGHESLYDSLEREITTNIQMLETRELLPLLASEAQSILTPRCI